MTVPVNNFKLSSNITTLLNISSSKTCQIHHSISKSSRVIQVLYVVDVLLLALFKILILLLIIIIMVRDNPTSITSLCLVANGE